MHPEIILFLSEHKLEYDLYTLIRAFLPSAQIRTVYSEEEISEADVLFRIRIRSEEEGSASADLEISGSACGARLLTGSDDPVLCRRTLPLSDPDDPAKVKNEVKRLLYQMLSALTQRELPWGDLTGIRPVMLVSGLMKQGMSDPEILSYMQETWHVSEQKRQLALQIAKREKELLDPIRPETGYSLYIGIPFCPTICLYCSFGSHPLGVWKKRTGEYLTVLEKELREIAAMTGGQG
ncbi:MAG: coproporphyrinogen dehydrogenase HemZ, partial [Eubacterium sp.]|nr:coproporphyrinogen dehydrogenase HemZ [Eubacterium sp.]